MTDSADIRSDAAAQRGAPRERSFFPIILLVIVLGTIGWMCTDSFRSRLDDTKLAAALAPTASTTDAQHAAEEITQRIGEEIDRGGAPRGQGVTTFYPALVAMAASPDVERRKSAAWAMQYDRKEPSFHVPLVGLLLDRDPYVARNAATSLAVRGSAAGRDVLLAMLQPYDVRAPISGNARMVLRRGDPIAAGHRIAMIELAKGEAEILSPIDGRAVVVATDGSVIADGAVLVSILSQSSALNAMQALLLPGIGTRADAEAIERFLTMYPDSEDKVLAQARASIAHLKAR